MNYFFNTVETIGPGLGFSYYGLQHLLWLVAFLALTLWSCMAYRCAGWRKRRRWQRTVAVLLVLDELFKLVMLLIGGNFLLKYLPFHLCSINIFLIAIHAWRPSKLLGNFLYLVCIPGAIAALLFPTWATLPLLNFMYLHSFTIHILLAMYPIVLTFGGDIVPERREFLKCVLLLLGMAVPIYIFNRLGNTNFMFLMYPEGGSPLVWFEEHWGNHLLGYPVLIAAVMAVMSVPTFFMERGRRGRY